MDHKNLELAIANLKEEEAVDIVKELLSSNENPASILETCRKSVEIVGKRFEDQDYFLPDLIMAGEILNKIAKIIKPKIQVSSAIRYLGRFLIGTVQGDIHDIGKNIAIFVLEANGFEVYDIGIDVRPEKFVEKIKEIKPDIVGLSGLLTLAYASMKRTIEAIEAAGLRDNLKIIIGGSQTDEKVREFVKADAYTKSAVEGVKISKKWMESKQ